MAGTYTPMPTIAVVRDTSGSMGDGEISAVTVEVEGIARQLGIRGRDLRVLDVDADLHAVRDYQAAGSLVEVTGRGGTDMCAGVKAAFGLRPRPSTVVVVTDGMTPWPSGRTPVPVVACLVGTAAEAMADLVPESITTLVVDP